MTLTRKVGFYCPPPSAAGLFLVLTGQHRRRYTPLISEPIKSSAQMERLPLLCPVATTVDACTSLSAHTLADVELSRAHCVPCDRPSGSSLACWLSASFACCRAVFSAQTLAQRCFLFQSCVLITATIEENGCV